MIGPFYVHRRIWNIAALLHAPGTAAGKVCPIMNRRLPLLEKRSRMRKYYFLNVKGGELWI